MSQNKHPADITPSATTQFAAVNSPEFGFCGGGEIHLVGASSSRVAKAAEEILAPLNKAATVCRETTVTTALAAAASFAALGDLSPAALGAGALAGVFHSVTKGSGRV